MPALPAEQPSPPAADLGAHLRACGLPALRRGPVTTLQLNIGKRCNLSCRHCHVESGPKRVEAMGARGVLRVLDLLSRNPAVRCLDVTGGAPELNPNFRNLVRGARSLGRRVVDRCNLTVLFEPGQQDTAEFLAAHEVEVVASLPCYTLETVERQRGRGVFGKSIEALRRLNELGYGRTEKLRLDLVYNPQGALLPPPQPQLEQDYRRELRALFGVEFHRLIAIANMPIKRFAHDLARAGQHEAYMSLLALHFNPETLPGLMCRQVLSVGYDGRLYDCDFNQALAMPVSGERLTIWDVDDLGELEGREIVTAGHCFGCTAGAGSSCGGALTP